MRERSLHVVPRLKHELDEYIFQTRRASLDGIAGLPRYGLKSPFELCAIAPDNMERCSKRGDLIDVLGARERLGEMTECRPAHHEREEPCCRNDLVDRSLRDEPPIGDVCN